MTVSAPNRIFLRGRGLEAELGGGIALRGTTANLIPSGQFELIRGRLDILGQRVSFSEGSVTLQGDFDPFVRLVAETQAEDVLVRIIVEGLASAPEVSFTSEPQLPEDEVLARLLFGRGLDTLSPLQAAQLANAVATLAGKGGEGLVGRLRQNFGLDDLDVSTGESGATELRAGKYISDNAYTDITVDSEGGAEASINLDISPSVTVRGKVGSAGTTGIGIFFERDY
jgi:translocation and assembly module TamB